MKGTKIKTIGKNRTNECLGFSGYLVSGYFYYSIVGEVKEPPYIVPP